MCMTCIRMYRSRISAVTTIRKLSQFLSVPLEKCQLRTSVWSRQLPSTHFPIRYSLTIRHSMPQSLIANLKDTTNKNIKNSPLFPFVALISHNPYRLPRQLTHLLLDITSAAFRTKFSHPEDGSIVFLRNAGTNLSYMV